MPSLPPPFLSFSATQEDFVAGYRLVNPHDRYRASVGIEEAVGRRIRFAVDARASVADGTVRRLSRDICKVRHHNRFACRTSADPSGGRVS